MQLRIYNQRSQDERVMIPTIYYERDQVHILNQNLLPARVEFEAISDYKDLVTAIKELKVRGAPLIGVTAAYGMALAMDNYTFDQGNRADYFNHVANEFASTRPTAVNLFWAIERMKGVFAANSELDLDRLRERLWEEARNICAEDIDTNILIGENGQKIFPTQARVLTICNAGALATCGYGTALGVIRSAFKINKVQRVWVCETRPVLQGARLTVWELVEENIPVSLITDSMAAFIMQQGKVDLVVTGADRIAANGDSANKIGTYALAVLANYHQIPFYIAAPFSTIDLNISSGDKIKIEERDQEEVRRIGDHYITVPEVNVYNPAFDITPAQLITGIITEAGVAKPPYRESLLQIRGM